MALGDAHGPRRYFRRAAEQPYRRRGSDVVRLVVGISLFGLLASRATRDSHLDRGLLEAFDSLPDLAPLARTLRWFGTMWTVGLVGVAALVVRRWRLARDLVLAGTAAWLSARVAHNAWLGHGGVNAALLATVNGIGVRGFPAARLAVLAAVAETASPYMGRPMRRLGQIVVCVTAVCTIDLGAGYFTDVASGVVLGWVVAAAVHLVFGSPGGRPTVAQLSVALAELEIDAHDVRLDAIQPADATVFLGTGADGPIRIKAIGRDEVEAQLLARSMRYVVYKDAMPPYVTRRSQVEHEALMSMMARDAGVHTPRVIYAGRSSVGAVLLVEQFCDGPRLSEMAIDDISDDLLRQIWTEVKLLRGARMSHGALDDAHVVNCADGPVIFGFATSTTAGYADRGATDVADLLATTAGIVGGERAVAACIEVLGAAAVATTLPLLQPAALTKSTRATLPGNRRSTRAQLDALRAMVASEVGSSDAGLQSPYRIRPSALLLALGGLVAVGVLLSQVGDPTQLAHVVRHANGAWIAVALALSLGTNLPFAIALIATVPRRLPLWPTTLLQVAMSYSNLAVPGVGGLAVQVRFLQRQGVDLASAMAAGGLLSAVGSVTTQIGLFVGAAWLSPDAFHLDDLPVAGLARDIAIGILAIIVVFGAAFSIPRVRHLIQQPLAHAASTIWGTLRSGRRLALLIVGNTITDLMLATCLVACLRAYDATLSFWTALAISTGLTTLSALVPIPGGSTALGSLGMSGALSAFGVADNVAISVALTNQLVVSYLPAVPGWFATRHLLNIDSL